MIREIIAAQLPVGEKLRIVKNRIEGKDPDSGRIAIVSGIHGDGSQGAAWTSYGYEPDIPGK